jgi:hypothetical protein
MLRLAGAHRDSVERDIEIVRFSGKVLALRIAPGVLVLSSVMTEAAATACHWNGSPLTSSDRRPS